MRVFRWLRVCCAVWSLAATDAHARSKRIFLDAGELQSRFEETLVRELGAGALVASREDAELWINVRRGRNLEVAVYAPPDTQLLARSLPLDGGLGPAFRAAVFLIAGVAAFESDATETSTAAAAAIHTNTTSVAAVLSPTPADTSTRAVGFAASAFDPAPAAPPRADLGLDVALGGVISHWRTPAAPELGLSLCAELNTRPLIYGLRAQVAGFGPRLVTAGLDAEHLELAITAQARLELWRSELFAFGPLARAGVGYTRFSGQARFRRGDGVEIRTVLQDRTAFDVRAELGVQLSAELWPEHVFLAASAGGGLTALRPRLVAPEPANDPAALDPGWWSGWAELAARVHIF